MSCMKEQSPGSAARPSRLLLASSRACNGHIHGKRYPQARSALPLCDMQGRSRKCNLAAAPHAEHDYGEEGQLGNTELSCPWLLDVHPLLTRCTSPPSKSMRLPALSSHREDSFHNSQQLANGCSLVNSDTSQPPAACSE
eukprot:479688-Pleurochrysis_carterae.AAC.6